MTLTVDFNKEVVRAYHFDQRNAAHEKEHGEPETNVRVTFNILDANYDTGTTQIMTCIEFLFVQPEYVLSGFFTQVATLTNKVVTEPNELKPDEIHQLVVPLTDLITRLTYDMTEIIFDMPGLTLSF